MPTAIAAAFSAVVSFISGSAILTFFATVAGSILLGTLTEKLFGRKAPRTSFAGIKSTVRGSLEPRRIVYGRAKIGGVISYNNVRGADNENLDFEVCYVDHLADAVEFYLDDRKIPIADIAWTPPTADATLGSGTGIVSTSEFVKNSVNALRITWYPGFGNQPANTLKTGQYSDQTSAHQLRGIFNVWFNLLYTQDVAEVWKAGPPQRFSVVLDGRRVYDSRKDGTNGGAGTHRYADDTTWEFSDNPALCIADYLFVYMDADPAQDIDWPSIAAAADDCDVLVSIPGTPTTEKRFTVNGGFLTDENHETVLTHLKEAMAGRLIWTGGEWTMYAGVFQTPPVSDPIDLTWLAGDVNVRGTSPQSERFNTCLGFYVDPDRDYHTVEFNSAINSAYVTRDAGLDLPFDMSLRFTNSEYMSQRIAIRKLDQFDNQIIIDVDLNEKGAKIEPGLFYEVTLTEFSWTDKVFRCVGWEPTPNGNYKVTLKEDFSTRYTDPTIGEYTTRTLAGVVVPPGQVVPPPTSLIATGLAGIVELNWENPPARLFAYVEIHRSTTDDVGTAVIIATQRGDVYLDAVNNTVNYFYWIRAVSHEGVTSLFEPSTTAGVAGTASSAGTDGLSVFVASVYLRKASAPTEPIDDDGSYNFTTGVLTPPSITGGSADNWFITPPAGSNPLYVSVGSFQVIGPTGTDTTVDWSAPSILVQDGATGSQGPAGRDGIIVGGIKKNTSTFAGADGSDPGEGYIHGLNSAGVPADVDGSLIYNGAVETLPKGILYTSQVNSQGFIVLDTNSASFVLSGHPNTAIVAAKLKISAGVAVWEYDDDSAFVSLTPTADHLVIGTYHVKTAENIFQAMLSGAIALSTLIIRAGRIEVAQLAAITATIGTLETRPEGGSPTTPRLIISDSDAPLQIFADDDSTLLFSLTDTGADELELYLLGDFASGTIDSGAMFSLAGIADLRGRLGVVIPGQTTGGTLTLPGQSAVLPVTSKDTQLLDPQPTPVDFEHLSGETITLTFQFYDSDSGLGTPPAVGNWTVKWQERVDGGSWVDVTGASFTFSGVMDSYQEDGQPPVTQWDYWLGTTKTFLYTSVSAGTDFEFRLNSIKNSGHSNFPRYLSASAHEPIIGQGVEITELDDVPDVDLTLAADDDMLVRSGGVWIDTGGLLTWNSPSNLFKIDGVLSLLERASAPADLATYGRFWTKDDTPNTPFFTDDTGVGYNLLLVHYPRSQPEIDNSKVPIDFTKLHGDALRFDAKIDGTTDDTAAFQDAIDSGHPAFCNVYGTANIEGTIVMNGGLVLTLNGGLNMERQSGSAVTPLLHMYGNENILVSNGSIWRQDLYTHLDGIVLIGPAVDETESGTTDVQCFGNAIIGHIKVVGAIQTIAQDGSIGIYHHSIGRKVFTVRNPTYDTYIESYNILNCDVGMEFSTDASRGVFGGGFIHQWKKAAIYFNGGYSNQFFGLKLESPLDVTTTLRYALHYNKINTGRETGTPASFGINSAFANKLNVYAELPSAGNKVVALFTHESPIAGKDGGHNYMSGPLDTLTAGYGIDGKTDEVSVGTNIIDGTELHIDYNRIYRFPGDWSIRPLMTAGGGAIHTWNSNAAIEGRVANMLESFHYDIFSKDNVGPTGDALRIILTWTCKESANSATVTGEARWLCQVEGSSANVPVRYFFHQDGGGEVVFMTPTCASSAGTDTDTGKYTISLNTHDVPSTGDGFCSWQAHLQDANLLGINLDWDDDVELLTTSGSGAVGNDVIVGYWDKETADFTLRVNDKKIITTPAYTGDGIADLDFVDGGGGNDSIVRTTGSWITDGFKNGETINVTGSASNDGSYVINSAPTATTLTVVTTSLTTESNVAATVKQPVQATLPGTMQVGDEITVHNDSQSTATVSIDPAAHSIEGRFGTITSSDTMTLARGDTAHLVCISTSAQQDVAVLEIV